MPLIIDEEEPIVGTPPTPPIVGGAPVVGTEEKPLTFFNIRTGKVDAVKAEEVEEYKEQEAIKKIEEWHQESLKPHSITDFTNKPEVQKRATRMMSYLNNKEYADGTNAADDFINYTRKADWNIGVSLKRSVELARMDKNDPDSRQFLNDYSNLLNEFHARKGDGSYKYENIGPKENLNLTGDIAKGFGTDITNWLLAFFTVGTTLPPKIAAQQAAAATLRQSIKNIAIKGYNTGATTKTGTKAIQLINRRPKIPIDVKSYKSSMSILGIEGGAYAAVDSHLHQKRFNRIGVEGYEEYDPKMTAYSTLFGITLASTVGAGITRYGKYKDKKILDKRKTKDKKESEKFQRIVLDEADPDAEVPKIISVEEAARLNRIEREKNNLPHPSHVEDVADFERRAADEEDLLADNFVNRAVDDDGIIITDETLNQAKKKTAKEQTEYSRKPPSIGGPQKWWEEGAPIPIPLTSHSIPVLRMHQKPTTFGKQLAEVSKQLKEEGLIEFGGTYHDTLRYIRNDALENLSDDPKVIAYDPDYINPQFSEDVARLSGIWVEPLESFKISIEQLAKREERYTKKKIRGKVPFTTRDWQLKDGSLLNDDLYLFLNQGRFKEGVPPSIIKEAAKLRKIYDNIEREAIQTGFIFHKVPHFFPRQVITSKIKRGKDGEQRYAQQLVDDGEIISEKDAYGEAVAAVREQVNRISDHLDPTVGSMGQRQYRNLDTYKLKDLFETDVFTQTWIYANSSARKIVIKRNFGFGATEQDNKIFTPIFGGELTKTNKQEGLELVTEHLIARGFSEEVIKDSSLQKYIKANFLARQNQEENIPFQELIKANARLRSNNTIINNSFRFQNLSVGERSALLGNTFQEEIDKIIINNFDSQTFTRNSRKIKEEAELSTTNVNWKGNKRLPIDEENRLRTLIGSLTGQWGRGTKRQEALSGTFLAAQAGNKLGLATISSLPEFWIPFFKATPKTAMKAFTKTAYEEGRQMASNLFKGRKGMASLTRKEMHQHNKMISSALSEAINAQFGEGLTGLSARFVYRFYRTIWLDQYTKFVQIYSYNAGKMIIRENLDKLAKMGDEAFNKNNSKATRLRLQINQLGVDVDAGIKWHKTGAKMDDLFYENLKHSADRFVNEVVMVPNRENAQKFLLSGHWAGRVAFQLYSYPVAFANTIARNAARDVVMTRGMSLPKVMAGGYLMYLTTGFTQSLKTRGRSEEREGWEKFKYVLDTIGLFGPYSLAYNMMENIDYGNNVPKSIVRLMGPTLGRLVLDLFNDNSTPFSSVVIKNTMPYRNLIKAASPKTIHEIDEFLKDLERRRYITRVLGVTPEGETTRKLKRLEADQRFLEEQVAGKEIRELEKLEKEQKDALLRLAEGGRVSKDYPVPFAKDNPSERKIDLEGESYAKVAGLFEEVEEEEEEERVPVGIGGILAKTLTKEVSKKPSRNKIVRTNLFKKKAGWKWNKAPEGFEKNPDGQFPLVSVETGGKHFYSLQADFPEGVLLQRYAEKTSEPRLRPTTTGVVRKGKKVGEISVRGKVHPVYDNLVVVDKDTKAVKGIKETPTKVVPAPQRFFDPEDKAYKPFLAEFDYEKGGRYVELSAEGGKKDITGVVPKQARISISPEGKASFTISKEFYESLFAEPITKSRKKKGLLDKDV